MVVLAALLVPLAVVAFSPQQQRLYEASADVLLEFAEPRRHFSRARP